MKIKIKDLHFSYGAKKVLNISSTEFEQGKIYGIVGKNGAGKTTFFKALTNIITNYSGDVLIDGETVKTNLKVLSKVGIVLDDMRSKFRRIHTLKRSDVVLKIAYINYP